MGRNRHANKVIELAIQYAESKGWHYYRGGRSAHAWGRLLCPLKAREGCSISIWSTPRNAEVHAKQIVKRVRQCDH